MNTQVMEGDQSGHRDHSGSIAVPDSRSSNDSEPEKLTARDWFAKNIADRRNQGHDTAHAFAVYEEGIALGYKQHTLKAIASGGDLVHVIRREGRGALWCIRPDMCTHPPARTAGEWLTE